MKRKKVLYAVQGTGNGHVARARQIIPLLREFADVDVWLGGDQSDVKLPVNPAFYVRGMVMYYNRRGGVSYLKTIFKNNYYQIIRDIFNAPVTEYDLVLNDFESITAWACRVKRKKCIAIGHQASFYFADTPRPRFKSLLGEAILRWYAPASEHIGFHFRSYTHHIYPPVIRQEVLDAKSEKGEHITVYLPAFHHDYLVELFKALGKHKFHIFSKHTHARIYKGNSEIHPISHERFTASMATSKGVICGAGFETPAEALYLGKKLLVIPIKNQYEQLCNAAALRMEGVYVLDKLNERSVKTIKHWLVARAPSPMIYPDYIRELLANLMLETPMQAVLR